LINSVPAWFRAAAVRYAAATAMVLAAVVGLRLWMIPVVGLYTSYLTVYPVVLFAAVFWGIGPGLFSAISAVLLVETFLIAPVGEISFGLEQAVRASVPIVSALFLGIMGNRLRGALRTAEEEARVAGDREAALRESEQRFRILFDSLPLGAVLLRPQDFTIAAFNDAAPRNLAYPPEEFSRLSIPEIDCLHDINEIRRNFKLTLSGEQLSFETRHRCRTGDERDVWVHTDKVSIGGKEYVLALFVDITERKRIEEELRRTQAILQEADRKKNEFLAVLAHELRDPLSAISSGVTLLTRTDLPQRSASTVKMIKRQARHLAKLVGDLLDVSRITRGMVRLERRNLDIKDPVKRALEVVQAGIKERQQRVVVDFPNEPLVIEGDFFRLQQIFTNLLVNAVQHANEGGLIEVRIKPEQARVMVSVRDDGPGIEEELHERIFQPFEQAGPGKTKAGMGIGLAVVKRLTEMHGGTVALESGGLGQGARFTVSLPLVEQRNYFI
jgi:PAS domain S-box-containing protein